MTIIHNPNFHYQLLEHKIDEGLQNLKLVGEK
jgi:hypothetical protein